MLELETLKKGNLKIVTVVPGSGDRRRLLLIQIAVYDVERGISLTTGTTILRRISIPDLR